MKKTKFIAAALAVLFVFNTYAIPRSKAVVIDATAAFGAAAATAAINGTTATTLFTGMSTSAATTAMTTLMGEYAVATGAASSGTAFAASIGASAVVTAAGALVIGAAAGYALFQFIKWLREEKGLEAGGNEVVLLEETGLFLNSGEAVSFVVGSPVDNVPFTGTIFRDNTHYFLQDGTEFYATPDHFFYKFSGETSFSSDSFTYVSGDSFGFFLVGTTVIVKRLTAGVTSQGAFGWTALWRLNPIDTSLSVQPNPDFQEIPSEIPEGHVLSIDTGLASLPVDDPQAAADVIMQSAIDGVLAPTVSVESDPTVTPDPEPVLPPEDLPQNLPELGDVLISRFPFSIPWDIGRVLDFLSAEPVAPHIEFQPFKGDLFGIPAGSVSVDYDFSKHEDIAAFCRTFEIVGFCLLLAVGTKRLIWTA